MACDASHWRKAALGELVESAVDGPFGSNLKSSHYVDEPGVRVVRLQNIGKGTFDDDDRTWISEDHARFLHRHDVRAEDVLVASLGDENHPFGRACLYPSDHRPGIVKADCFRLRIEPHAGVPGFISRVLNCEPLRRALNGLAQGVTRDRVNLGNLLRFEIPTPPLPEQRCIAEILDTLDEAIRKTEQLIAKLKQVKQGLLHDLLTRGIDDNGELRDAERHPEQFKDSPLGRIPQEWKVVHLRDLYAEPARNGLYKPPQFHGRGPLMVQMGNIFRGLEVSFDGAGRVEVTPSELATYGLRPGDLLFGRRSLVMEGAGKCALVAAVTEPSTFESSIVRVRVKPDRVAPLFVAYFLTGDAGYRDRRRFIRQVAVSGVSSGDIAEFVIAVPPRHEQDSICASVRTADERLATESVESDKLRLLKHGLMEDLLTGRVCVTTPLNEAAA